MKTISYCRACQGKKIVNFLDLGKQPLANNLLKNLQQKEAFYPLSLAFCQSCHLVQLEQTVEPKDLFSQYFWVTSTSKTAKNHAEVFYQGIMTKVNNLAQDYVLEVASNDGTFLLPFIKRGYRVLGVDPAQNIVKLARKRKIPTQCGFFGERKARQIVRKFGCAKVVIARNVLPHVANLHDFIKGLYFCLEKDGLLVVEFHYAKKIFEELHYDSIYHEHLCYFSLESVERLFDQFGLRIVDLEESPISGGGLILYLKKIRVKEATKVQLYRNKERRIGLSKLSSWQAFSKKVFKHRDNLVKLLAKVKQNYQPFVGWGASARSSTLLNFCHINSRDISMIADKNPLKHSHFTPGTHIEIKQPQEVMSIKPPVVIILAWNFTNEIMQILRKKYGFHGLCIVPLPNRPKIIKVQ